MTLTIDQRADVAERTRMAEERDIEFLRRFVEREKNRIVHLPVFGVTHQVCRFAAQLFDTTA